MTKEQAQAKLQERISNPQWAARFARGGADERAEWRALTAAIAGVPDPSASKSPAKARLDDLQRDGEWLAKFKKGDPAAVDEFRTLTSAVTAGEAS